MNRDQIIKLAREHDLHCYGSLTENSLYTEILCEFVAAIRAATKEEDAKRRGVLLFNPYTGKPRHPSDISSDPHGILMLDPEQPIMTSK